MKKTNIIISLVMVFVLYRSLAIVEKIGIIRDEYGITGNGFSFTFTEMICLIIFPLIIIILNLVMFFQKKEVKNGIKYCIVIVSILVSAVSVLSLLSINNNLNKSVLQIL